MSELDACIEAWYRLQDLESWRLGTIGKHQWQIANPKKCSKLKWQDIFPPMHKGSRKKRGLDLKDMQLFAMAQIADHYKVN